MDSGKNGFYTSPLTKVSEHPSPQVPVPPSPGKNASIKLRLLLKPGIQSVVLSRFQTQVLEKDLDLSYSNTPDSTKKEVN